MKTIETFLKELLESQELNQEQLDALEEHRIEVTDFLRDKFGLDPVIKFAGSAAKGTMNQDSYDLDIVCYFPSSDSRTLKEIRTAVSDHLKTKYSIFEKASAERIIDLNDSVEPSNYHIDVVPGRFIQDTKDVFIYLASGDKERLKTNLKPTLNISRTVNV
ncbi:MAG: nucleotidyltransferase domain-containing protein [Bacteroidetes bacterium]|nr:nucleotidyltransferase domain-containing protein [Bacteroidota bacterium]